jgi:ankyrin repeat protein
MGGALGVYRNEQYNKAYDTAQGRTIHGAAAADNSAGVSAWLNYYGDDRSIAQLGSDKLTPLMVAAGNGAEQAAQAIGDAMPTEYEVVESVTETESEELRSSPRHARPEVATVRSKAVKKKRVKTNTMQDASGKTALHWAYDGRHWTLARMLISKGKADGMVADNCGRTIKDMTVDGKPLAEVVNNPCKHGYNR